MPARPLLTAAALALAAAVTTLPLTGCETIERETGLGRSTQAGAAGGAAFGGIVAALAGANPAWIAASTILGGVGGGAIGEYLGADDAEQHVENNLNALDTLGAGQTSRWQDDESGNSGSTTVHSVFTSDGRTCKSYTETVRTAERTVSKEATACQTADGGWAVEPA